jgi:CPA2 family monovalent cation:H+ antiporter-2
VLAAVGLSILLNLAAGLTIARLDGADRLGAANIALTLLGRGELSLILATLAAGAGLDDRLGPFVALYVLVLAVLGPLLTAHSRRIAVWLPGRSQPVGQPA